MSKNKIWRINMKKQQEILFNENNRNSEVILNDDILNNYIGLGWSSKEGFDKDIQEKDFEVEEIVNKIRAELNKEVDLKKRNDDLKHFNTDIQSIFIEGMKIEDFVWIKFGKIYKLGKITGECRYNLGSKYIPGKYQIGFYRKVEILNRDFDELEIPKKVIASFKVRRAVQRIEDETDGSIIKHCESCYN
ncbi:MAG: hypothetical protein HXM47_00490 [Pseudoleptotrichia goodfellowii]|nr:hypothetical protein [Pseudoleptotrichia goodfellowii]